MKLLIYLAFWSNKNMMQRQGLQGKCTMDDGAMMM